MISRTNLYVVLCLVVFGMIGPTVEEATAQYFGRNKVQYNDFDFEVLKTEHFDIYFYEAEEKGARMAARMAERWYERLSDLLDHDLSGRQPLILYASHPHFRQTNVIQGMIGQGTGGVTEPLKRRIVMPLAGFLAETDHVLGHELVHAFQFDIAGGSSGRLPLWFVEGMAEYLSVGPFHPLTSMWMRDSWEHDNLPSVTDLNSAEYFPYRFGHAFWAFLSGEASVGDSIVSLFLKGAGGNPVKRLEGYFNTSSDTISMVWHQSIQRQYAPVRRATGSANDFGRRLLWKENAGEYVMAPALSPDGSLVVFLSERSQFGLELFLADAESGEVLDKISDATMDPHFQSLEFVQSSGGWSPDGTRFAYVGVGGGAPILTIFDVESRDVVEKRKFSSLGQIFNPTWSPDGSRIAFTGLSGGLSDLFVYTLESDSLVALTDDPFAELHPAWSPDGVRIAFATDRFTSDLEALDFGAYHLATFDLESGQISDLPGFGAGKHINPQWSPDGRSIYFLADRGALTNVYRLNLSSGEIAQITDLFTGVTGISATSPALSVSASSGALAYTVFNDGNYEMYRTDDPVALWGGRLSPPRPSVSQIAMLPPENRGTSEVTVALNRERSGLPPETEQFATEDYTPGLSLDYIAQPSVVAGADQFGAFVGGGSALYFGDMLAHHRLGTMFQINGGFESIAAAVSYQNQANRMVWGGTAQRIPYITGGFNRFLDIMNGDTVLVEQQVRYLQTNYRAAATAWYPFSQVMRVEFSAGYRNLSFKQEVRSRIFDYRTGALIDDETRARSPFDALNLGMGTVALAYDNSFYNSTAPVRGQRYRFEASPTIGSLMYVEALGDYRRYVMPVRPFTLAFRVLHYGRYGSDADDEILTDLSIGYPGLVRGYRRTSIDASDCEPTQQDPCPLYTRLHGTRMAVANAELRIPLFDRLGFADPLLGIFPVNLAVFFDAGLAWRRDIGSTNVDERAFFLGGDREPLYSSGAAVRTSIFRMMMLEFSVAWAFQRDRWVTQLSFIPGF